MIVCPVCEHQQAQGNACDNCGKVLTVVKGAEEAPVTTLVELERTAIANPKLAVAAEAMPELELTKMKVGPDLPAQQLPELDRHQIASAGPVAVEAMPDMDRGREQDDGERTQLSDQIVCRYCRNVQASGVLCDKCGMRLPKPAATAAAASKGKVDPDAVVLVLCGCGAKAVAGRRCGSCGAKTEVDA